MKRVIANPFLPLPKSEKSHVRGWAQVWADRLGADIADKNTDLSKYDEIYIDHGVNFSGGLNLFGGLNDEVITRIEQMLQCSEDFVQIYSLDHDMKEIDYGTQMAKRLGSNSTSSKLTQNMIDASQAMFLSAETLKMYDLSLDELILGDSHSVAYSMSNQMIDRNNGKTLHSVMLKDPDFKWIIDKIHPVRNRIKELTLCLGSIDVRFHVLGKNKISAKDLAQKYDVAAFNLSKILGIPVKVCAPVPIEFEERRIPGTGKYEGQNFIGSREQRLEFTMDFIELLENSGIEVVKPPEDWYKMDGEEFAKEIMEANSSVHIAPKNYNSVLGWEDYDCL
ncbi:MAG: hypothetical protein PHG15_03695 [Acinetobacter sp.]|uniref:hypothetical protein n=1 Tax=Acinetobacter sp. TaxID=472 RepID=UPI00262CAEB6|nr:hypothetical protein [Acinetobacter sp.]MDD2944915.1 hypothetical protein [Acinetobacter sp.]